jgi:cyclophilin family peptidyl-prolyl cis-trans isomerase
MSRILTGLLLLTMAAASRAQDAAAPPADEAAARESAVGESAAGDPAATAEAPPPSPEAQAASDAFEGLVKQWEDLIAQLKALQQQRDAATGQARQDLEAQMADVRKLTAAQLDKLAAAALEAYRLDPNAFPRVNSTLLSIIQFYAIGDAHGDGGDQYEKALPLAQDLIDAGAGDKFPQLYLVGGVAAYCVGDLDLAGDYLARAKQGGMFDGLPEERGDEPLGLRLHHAGQRYLASLPDMRKHWEAEQKIRAAEAQADDLPRVKFTTNKGDIVLELFENEAPQAVGSFLTLTKKGFFDGLTFHRVLPQFMAQGGDPDGTGMGGPGYSLRDEFGAPNARRHFRGSLAMAHSQSANSSGSQFYITFVPTSMLDGGYTVFGRVLEGMDVVAAIKRRDPNAAGPKPVPDKIIKAEVLRDRGHEYKFDKLPRN